MSVGMIRHGWPLPAGFKLSKLCTDSLRHLPNQALMAWLRVRIPLDSITGPVLTSGLYLYAVKVSMSSRVGGNFNNRWLLMSVNITLQRQPSRSL